MDWSASVPLAMSARARKSVSMAFNLNIKRAFFRVEAMLNASGDACAPVIFLILRNISK